MMCAAESALPEKHTPLRCEEASRIPRNRPENGRNNLRHIQAAIRVDQIQPAEAVTDPDQALDRPHNRLSDNAVPELQMHPVSMDHPSETVKTREIFLCSSCSQQADKNFSALIHKRREEKRDSLHD